MEQKKIDTYNAGYQTPVPVELGRWYERVTQDDIDEFIRREKENESNWAEPNNDNIVGSDDYYCDIMGGVCFGCIRERGNQK